MPNVTENLIKIIKTGSPAEVKSAQKSFERHWDKLCRDKNSEDKKSIFQILLREIRNIDNIKDDEHRAYLINTLRFRLWLDIDKHFEELRDFILKYIQHPSGKVRIAVVRACDYLVLELGMKVRWTQDEMEKDGAPPETEAENRKNRIRFGFFVRAVEDLLQKYHEPRFNRYKYVGNMPPLVYKSLQQLMAEKLLRSEYYTAIYSEFLARISNEGRA